MPDSPDLPTVVPPYERFAKHLHRLSQDAPRDGTARARLARLRRAIDRRGVNPLAFREVGDAIPRPRPDQSPEAYRRMQDDYLIVATLYAVHAAKSDKPWYGQIGTNSSFGASCGKLRGRSGSMDQRFAALLDARRDDLPHRLRQAVALLATDDVGVRYGLLLRDLHDWDRPDRAVQRRWAAHYWTR